MITPHIRCARRCRRAAHAALLLAAALPAATAHAADLSYPPPGVAAPVAEAGAGARATPLSPEEAAAREALYARGHVVILPGFDTARARPVEPGTAQPPPAAPASATAPPAGAAPAVAAPAAGGGLLWRIEADGRTPSYLFGTIHVEDPRVLALPARVRGALLGARSFAMEVLPHEIDQAAVSMAMFFTDGRTLEAVAGTELAQRAAALLAQRGIPQRTALIMKPWAAAVTLSSPAPGGGRSLDAHLYDVAAGRGIAAYGLESVAEQFATFDAMALDDQVALLRQAVEEHGSVGAAIDEMIDAYLARDLERLQHLARGARAADRRLADEFMRRVVTERNLRMAERMDARLREGGAFVAVGALHLPGESGLVALLRDRGYRVTAVY